MLEVDATTDPVGPGDVGVGVDLMEKGVGVGNNWASNARGKGVAVGWGVGVGGITMGVGVGWGVGVGGKVTGVAVGWGVAVGTGVTVGTAVSAMAICSSAIRRTSSSDTPQPATRSRKPVINQKSTAVFMRYPRVD
jgi:hypothetical protein